MGKAPQCALCGREPRARSHAYCLRCKAMQAAEHRGRRRKALSRAQELAKELARVLAGLG